jgi:hypothetical protein
VRAELARGDLRALYLGWLGHLGASLGSLVEFLRISPDLVAAAATASLLVVSEEPKAAEVHAWVAKLSRAKKDELLARMITGDTALASGLLRRMRRERRGDENIGEEAAKRRTAAELLRDAENAGEARRRFKAEKTAKEKARREPEAAIATTQHLEELAGRESTLWGQVEELIATKQPKGYDEVLTLLADLRDLAARDDGGDFRRRLDALRGRHARKVTLINRLRKAGL